MERSLSNIERHQNHLEGVSRSFAFCIAHLEAPFREWVGLSYLLLRILDTIEDSPWSSVDEQKRSFQWFLTSFQSNPSAEEWKKWSGQFSDSISSAERKLIEDGESLIADWKSLPEKIQASILLTVKKMAEGMQVFLFREDKPTVVQLKSLEEVDQYCHIVAGIVGVLLYEFYLFLRPQEESQKSYSLSDSFGKCLQKVNILKDQLKDEEEGRYYVCHRSEVFSSFESNLDAAFDFSNRVLSSEKSLRRFCLWSLFLAVASIQKGATGEILANKISKIELATLLNEVDQNLDHSEKLQKLWELRRDSSVKSF